LKDRTVLWPKRSISGLDWAIADLRRLDVPPRMRYV